MFCALFAFAAVCCAPLAAADATGAEPAAAAVQRVMEDFGKVPLAFEPNRGQTDPAVDFLARGAGYNLFLTATAAVLAWPEPPAGDARSNGRLRALRLEVLGAAAADGEGLEPLAGKSHYFVGADPAAWRTGVPSYARVRYRGVYPGVDLDYYGRQRTLEYDFVVAPGADPRAIRLAFHGADRLRLDEQGNLRLEIADHELIHAAPFIYQESAGGVRRVAGKYVLEGRNRVAFKVAAYDTGKPLVIDPPVSLAYSTYLGGSGFDAGLAIAVDGDGASYVTGSTPSLDFPTTEGAFQVANGGLSDAFVTKLNADGSGLAYSTYLGGNGNDDGFGIAVDALGNAYVVGSTRSTNFPLQNALQPVYGMNGDAFATKLNPTGTALVYSTYLGGPGQDIGFGAALDAAGNLYATGLARAGFPTTALAFQEVSAGGDDAFVTKIDAGAALVYSTFLGGTSNDNAQAIAVDGFGSAYVTGQALSDDFPTANPFQATRAGGLDAVVAKLDPLGADLVYSTYLGGSRLDRGRGIAVDGAGNAYVTGESNSADDFPTASPLQRRYGGDPVDGFVTKLSAVGDTLVYSTFLGGRTLDIANAIAVDGAGNAYVAGETNSSNFPRRAGGPLSAPGGSNTVFICDGFVVKLDPGGVSFVYSTRLAGVGDDFANGIAVDANGDAYVTGETRAADFPVTDGAFQGTLAGGGDAFVLKLTGGD